MEDKSAWLRFIGKGLPEEGNATALRHQRDLRAGKAYPLGWGNSDLGPHSDPMRREACHPIAQVRNLRPERWRLVPDSALREHLPTAPGETGTGMPWGRRRARAQAWCTPVCVHLSTLAFWGGGDRSTEEEVAHFPDVASPGAGQLCRKRLRADGDAGSWVGGGEEQRARGPAPSL